MTSSGAVGPRNTEERLAAVTIGPRQPHNAPVELAPYDPQWPQQFADLAARVRAALGDRILRLEHVGSTSVPGLSAKPTIDMVLEVESTADEASYVPPLKARAFTLRIREPDWFEHRLLKSTQPAANLHVFSAGCPEIERMLAFRDRLRTNDEDRSVYERTKIALAARTWVHVQDYADAKSDVVRAILERATREHRQNRTP